VAGAYYPCRYSYHLLWPAGDEGSERVTCFIKGLVVHSWLAEYASFYRSQRSKDEGGVGGNELFVKKNESP